MVSQVRWADVREKLNRDLLSNCDARNPGHTLHAGNPLGYAPMTSNAKRTYIPWPVGFAAAAWLLAGAASPALSHDVAAARSRRAGLVGRWIGIDESRRPPHQPLVPHQTKFNHQFDETEFIVEH